MFPPDRAPLFWPDIDVYFRRDLSQALHLVDRVAAAGGRYLKGAVLHREDLCLKGGRPVAYYDKSTGTTVSEPYEDVIARLVVPLETLDRILRHARAAGLALVLSVYDREGIAFARDIGAVAMKVPSSNITHKALIEEVAAGDVPIVVDTGRSRFAEIERAVGWVRRAGGGERLLLQHSPPGPPAPAGRFHLRMMAHMGRAFGCPVGHSDHHSGLAMVPLAVALGARVIEKGLVMDGAAADIDIAHALPVSRLPEALALIEESWQALGADVRPDAEVPASPPDRMCVIAARTITAGEVIGADALDFAFPPLGIGAEDLDVVIGCTAQVEIPRGTPISREAIRPADGDS